MKAVCSFEKLENDYPVLQCHLSVTVSSITPRSKLQDSIIIMFSFLNYVRCYFMLRNTKMSKDFLKFCNHNIYKSRETAQHNTFITLVRYCNFISQSTLYQKLPDVKTNRPINSSQNLPVYCNLSECMTLCSVRRARWNFLSKHAACRASQFWMAQDRKEVHRGLVEYGALSSTVLVCLSNNDSCWWVNSKIRDSLITIIIIFIQFVILYMSDDT
jgi:hypothetical protein